jgi:hypothetical protein
VPIVGSELIRNNIDQFFNAPMANMVSSARDISSDYYRPRQRLVSSVAPGFCLPNLDVVADRVAMRDLVGPIAIKAWSILSDLQLRE